jgi:predicted RNA-binding protein with PIN domain
MLWLLDGYNVLHAIGLLSDRRVGPHGLEKARLTLLGRLAAVLGERAGRAVVVFDAKHAPPDVPTIHSYHGVQVKFARHRQEADDLIEQLIHDNASRSLTVVSNDLRLVRAAKHRQCKTMSCEEFMAWLERQRQPQAKSREEPDEKKEGLPSGRVDPFLKEFAELDYDPSLGEDLTFEE